MDAIDKRVKEFGYSTLWEWLAGNPDLDWIEVGRVLGFAPVVVARKSTAEAPSRAAAVRQSLLRWMRDLYRDGWDPSDTFQRAHLSGALFSEFRSTPREIRDALLSRVDQMPRGWRPVGAEDPDLVGITADLFEEGSP